MTDHLELTERSVGKPHGIDVEIDHAAGVHSARRNAWTVAHEYVPPRKRAARDWPARNPAPALIPPADLRRRTREPDRRRAPRAGRARRPDRRRPRSGADRPEDAHGRRDECRPARWTGCWRGTCRNNR